jgi:hypothetical protein
VKHYQDIDVIHALDVQNPVGTFDDDTNFERLSLRKDWAGPRRLGDLEEHRVNLSIKRSANRLDVRE